MGALTDVLLAIISFNNANTIQALAAAPAEIADYDLLPAYSIYPG